MTATAAAPETHAFQAEIRQLLDIVIHSLYTDRDIFVRELISNAADATKKFRYQSLLSDSAAPSADELEIRIETDAAGKRLTFRDAGVGLTHAELIEHLGSIASSGTKRFLNSVRESGKAGEVNLIGQFGVGFYSAFMVAKKVTVETRSYHPDAQGLRWESDGQGSYSIAPAEVAARGTAITLELKDDAADFADGDKIKELIHRYSNFVAFPILVDGEKVNTVSALWARPKSGITDAEYTEFYKFVSMDWQEPRYRLHFSADAPLAIRALLFAPMDNMERLGIERLDPGVDLYCRKVLIMKHPEKLLPEWMRFVRGVVDSDDLPLNISRETLQDSALVRKLGKVITGKFLKHLEEELKRDAATYDKFFQSHGRFLKEGITSDHQHRDELAKLLRFETSKTQPGEFASLADYIGRMKPEQTDIYYISGPSRAAIEAGPYVEGFRERDLEVIYNLDSIDDFVFDLLREFDGKPLRSGDRSDLKLPDVEKSGDSLTAEESDALCGWLKETLGERVGSVRASNRLVSNPAVVVTEGMLTASMQRLMMAMNKDNGMGGKQLTLEVNPRHAFIRRLNALRSENGDFAKQLAEQLFDNGLLAAGLLQDPRLMVERMNAILQRAAGG